MRTRYVEHLFRELIREHQLGRRRPRTFGGMGARLDKDPTLLEPNLCATELDKSMLKGVVVAALWTADRACWRGLRLDDRCPYCDQGVPEDEDHLLWWWEAWKSARARFLAEVMLLAKASKLGALPDRPLCVRLCGLIPEAVVKRSGMARGAGWKKRCRELNRVPRH